MINLTKEVISKLDEGHVGRAIEYLWIREDLLEISKDPEWLFVHSRLVGHIGEYSEALRALTEIMQMTKHNSPWFRRALVWSGVYWSRLGDLQRASNYLQRCPASLSNPEDIVLRWSHLLTVAVKMRRFQEIKELKGGYASIRPKLKSHGTLLAEADLWCRLLGALGTEVITPESAESISAQTEADRIQIGKQSFVAHVHHAVGQLWLRAGVQDTAFEFLKSARKQALMRNAGVAFVAITLDYHDALPANDQNLTQSSGARQLIREATIVAGQHGLGLIPCPLVDRLFRLINKLPHRLKSLHRQWLLFDRHLPDLTRLKGDVFERWCIKCCQEFCERLFEIRSSTEVRVTPFAGGQEGIDFIVHIPALGKNIGEDCRIGVQCKGGSTPALWTASAFSEKVNNFQDKLSRLHSNYPYITHYAFMCTTRVELQCSETVNSYSKKVLNSKAFIFDAHTLIPLLFESLELRLMLAMTDEVADS